MRVIIDKPFNFIFSKLMVAGLNHCKITIFAQFDRFFIAFSSLKISQISSNLSIKFAIVATNIDNSWMAIAIFFTFLSLIFNVSSTRIRHCFVSVIISRMKTKKISTKDTVLFFSFLYDL